MARFIAKHVKVLQEIKAHIRDVTCNLFIRFPVVFCLISKMLR